MRSSRTVRICESSQKAQAVQNRDHQGPLRSTMRDSTCIILLLLSAACGPPPEVPCVPLVPGGGGVDARAVCKSGCCGSDGKCQTGDVVSACGVAGGACAACVSPQGCSSARRCEMVNQGIGDPCVSDASCASGHCAGGGNSWCTATCSQSRFRDCAGSGDGGTNKFGQRNVCDTNSKGFWLCFPGCARGDADCKEFPGATCQAPWASSVHSRSCAP